MSIPTFYDDGEDSGAYADALLFPPWRACGPDSFNNGGARLPNGDDTTPPVSNLSHVSEVADG